MQVFISHNSHDKIKSLRLRDDLRQDGHTVWMDTHEIDYGENISDAILKGLEAADLVVVLWSQFSAASRGVAHEIEHSRSLQKRVIFCLLDETEIPAASGDFGDLAMHFFNYHSGLAVLKGEILQMQYRSMSQQDDALEAMMPVQKEASKLHEHFSRPDLRGTTKNEDKFPMIRLCLKMYMKVPSEQHNPDRQSAFTYLNAIIDEMEESMGDPGRLVDIQQKLVGSSFADHKIAHMLNHTAAAILAEGHPEIEVPGDQQVLEQYAEMFNNLIRDGQQVISQVLIQHYPGDNIAGIAAEICYYLQSSLTQLSTVRKVAEESGHPAVQRAWEHLFAYLRQPDDLIDDSAGIWGFLDDAWLIQNTVYRCVEAGLISNAEVDWQRIRNGDALILGLFTPALINALQNHLVQIIEDIQQQLPVYQPTVSYDTQTPFASMAGINQALQGNMLEQVFANMLIQGMMNDQQSSGGGQCFEDQVVAMGFGSLL